MHDSNGPLRPPGYANHSCRSHHHRSVLYPNRLVRLGVAHWVYRTESIQLGHESKLLPALTTNPSELHLERRAMFVYPILFFSRVKLF